MLLPCRHLDQVRLMVNIGVGVGVNVGVEFKVGQKSQLSHVKLVSSRSVVGMFYSSQLRQEMAKQAISWETRTLGVDVSAWQRMQEICG